MSIDLLAVLDLDTTILEVSASWKRTLGWDPAEIVGRSLLELFDEDDLPRIGGELATILAGGEALAVVVRVRTAEGTYRWVQGNARADLEAGRIYVTAADINERMALEEALRDQIALEELVASIASRLIGVDSAEVPAEIERAVGELGETLGADRAYFLRGSRRREETTYVEWLRPGTGLKTHSPAPEREVQRWWREALEQGREIHLDDVEELRGEAPNVVDALREEGVWSLLHIPLPPHRRFWGFLTLVSIERPVSFSEAASALLRLAGECFMSALSQREAAVALLDARAELEQRNRALERSNEELERFAYAAAHDLKAPLSRVEMALSATPRTSGPADDLLDIARRGASRMRQLIEDLLTFAAVGQSSGSPEPTDLDAVLTQVLVDHERAIEEGGVTVVRSPLPEVLGYPPLLGQLLSNLVANAVKFTHPERPPRLEVSATVDGEGTTLTVADNGIGIEPAHRQDVFGVFTRLGSGQAHQGSGIGLATCAKVAAHHGGRIWVDDGFDGGTAVHTWLPAQPAATG